MPETVSALRLQAAKLFSVHFFVYPLKAKKRKERCYEQKMIEIHGSLVPYAMVILHSANLIFASYELNGTFVSA